MGCSDILPQVARRSSKKIAATRGGGELPPWVHGLKSVLVRVGTQQGDVQV